MTVDELKALQPGQPVVDERGIEWIVACTLLAGYVGVSQGDWRYRLIDTRSPFKLPKRSGE